ncbi:MAG: bacteriohopanetetrol glucosamine biosynthesis glycosyltransferase HpnI, partial [Acidimicrobiales bacterium]
MAACSGGSRISPAEPCKAGGGSPMHMFCYVLILLTALGAVQAVAGLFAVRVFAARRRHPVESLSPVTILKPVCGDEPMLEEAIISFCVQQYPAFQLLVGAHDPNDPALQVVRRLQARFPECEITVVADPTLHGPNRKIANLMNMLPFAKHDLLVFADSDLHVTPDYLVRVVAALEQAGTGLVTTLYGGEPAVDGIPALLGATHISHSFLPGALLAAALGRQDCLGCTMALRRETLEQVGGLGALVGHLADDNVLGQKIRQLGLAIRLADTVPVVTVQDRSFSTLWLHELRWARTIGALAPIAFSASVLQFPLFWALLAVVLSGGALWAIGCFAAAWIIRAAVVR